MNNHTTTTSSLPTSTPARNPTVALATLGRSRPGFDRQWAQVVERACIDLMKQLFNAIIFEKPLITPGDVAELRHCLHQSSVDVCVFIQPIIADATLLPHIIASIDGASIYWATAENPHGTMVSNSLVGSHLYLSTLRQHGRVCGFVYGDAHAPATATALHQEVQIMHAAYSMRTAHIGLLGGHAPGFIDLHIDPRTFHTHIGAHLSTLPLSECTTKVQQPHPKEDYYLAQLQSYPLQGVNINLNQEILGMQARYWAYYADIITTHGFDALAIRCWPELPDTIGHWPYVAVSALLTEGVAMAIEGDVGGAVCTLISRYLTQKTAYLTDWLAHTQHSITLWHGGAIPFHFCPTSEPITVAPHFNNGRPAVVEAQVSSGRPLTLFSLWYCDGGYFMGALEGESTQVTQPFSGTVCTMHTNTDVHQWFARMLAVGMPHHVSVAEGHIHYQLKRLSSILNIKWAS